MSSIVNNSDEKGYYYSNENIDEIYYYDGNELFPVKIITLKGLRYSVRVNESSIKLKNIKKKMTMIISNLRNQYTRIQNVYNILIPHLLLNMIMVLI